MRGKVRKENLELHGISSMCNQNWEANESKEARKEEIDPEGWEYDGWDEPHTKKKRNFATR